MSTRRSRSDHKYVQKNTEIASSRQTKHTERKACLGNTVAEPKVSQLTTYVFHAAHRRGKHALRKQIFPRVRNRHVFPSLTDVD